MDVDTIPSFIEVLLNNVPFSHSSVTFIGFIYFLSISIISIWLLILVKKLGKKTDFWSYLAAGLLLIVTLSATLSIFFLGKFTFEIIIIWVLPSILIFWFAGFIRTLDKPLVLVAAFINSLYFLVSYALVLEKTNTPQTNQLNIYIWSLILFIFIPTFCLIFTSRKFSLSNKTLFIIPILLCFTIIMTYKLINSIGSLILIIIIIYLLAFVIAIWFKNKYFNRKNSLKANEHINPIPPVTKPVELDDPGKLKKMGPLLLIMLVTLFFISLISIPYPALETGKYIRTIIEPNTTEAITINNKTYIGHVVAYKDGIFYISYKWELLKIKSDQALIGNRTDQDLFPKDTK